MKKRIVVDNYQSAYFQSYNMAKRRQKEIENTKNNNNET